MKFFIVLWLSIITTSLFAQHIKLPIEHPIYLYDSINKSHYEFSGLAKWKDKILLIPQHRSAADKYHIVAVDTTSIDSVINNKTNFALQTKKLVFNPEIDTLYKAIKKAMLPRKDFGGIEAGVVVNDDIFFTVETDTICYIIKGTIDGNTMQIHFKPTDTMSLPKPDYSFGNAGFESLTYLPQQHKLIAAYENNSITGAPTAYTFTTDLANREAVTFANPLLFRLTDMAYSGNNTLIGLNHFYLDYSNAITCGVITSDANTLTNEYCYYIGDNLAKATKEMQANPQQTNFTRLVQLTFHNNILDWKTLKIISYSSDNWEGILPYKNGLLMVVDGRPPGVPCKLSYFDLK